MVNKKISIIGLGLIGGSLARALRERIITIDITAVSKSSEPIEQALKDGNIDRGFNEINEYVWNSDIIFICTPVKKAFQYIDILAEKVKPGCILTDVGSTKEEIIGYINTMENAPCFIGGHPMAGSEKTGYSASFGHLFENAYYILCPSKTTTQESLGFMTELVQIIGAIPVTLDAAEHDKITGTISHVPHIIAAALVNMVRETDGDGRMQLLAAGGFKDITRIASSDPEMWENIILSNKNQVESLIDSYICRLYRFKNFMENNDSAGIYNFFDSAKSFRNTFSGTKKGLIAPVFDIVVDVVDKPGIIGEIATILGCNGVNIKNINVANSREYEQGCLRITLPDTLSVNIAFDLLSEKGYKVYKKG